MTRPIYIVDATLREGVQAPHVILDLDASVAIARALDAAGVDMVEVGHPSASESELARVRAVAEAGLSCPVLAHARATPEDVAAVAEAGADWVGIFLGVNEVTLRARLPSVPDTDALIDKAAEAIAHAKSLGLSVRYTCEDTSRTDPADVQRTFARALEAGADRLCFADSVGGLEPLEVNGRVAAVRRAFPETPLEVHLHDDRGLALANALAAIDGGADWVSASVLGLGERCGITETCALIANLAQRGQRALPAAGTLPALAAVVSDRSGVPTPRRAPVVGAYAFTHTAKLHVRAVERDPLSYAWMAPEALGRETEVAPRE